MIELDDDRLAPVLASIGDQLVVSAAPATSRQVRPRRVQWAPALGLAAAALAVVLAVAPLRHTVADWLGIGSTRVIIEPPPATTSPATTSPASTSPASVVPATTSSMPAIVDGLDPIDAAAATALLGGRLPPLDGSTLGAPSAYARMPDGGVLAIWPTGETLWIHISSMPTDVMLDKLVASSDLVRRVDDLGDAALAVTGDHVLRTPHRLIDATTTVLWVVGDLELRLEGDRPADELIAIARQLGIT